MLEAGEQVNSNFCYYVARLYHRSAGGLLLYMMQATVEKESLSHCWTWAAFVFLHGLIDSGEWWQQTALSSSRWSPLVWQLSCKLLALHCIIDGHLWPVWEVRIP